MWRRCGCNHGSGWRRLQRIKARDPALAIVGVLGADGRALLGKVAQDVAHGLARVAVLLLDHASRLGSWLN